MWVAEDAFLNLSKGDRSSVKWGSGGREERQVWGHSHESCQVIHSQVPQHTFYFWKSVEELARSIRAFSCALLAAAPLCPILALFLILGGDGILSFLSLRDCLLDTSLFERSFIRINQRSGTACLFSLQRLWTLRCAQAAAGGWSRTKIIRTR